MKRMLFNGTHSEELRVAIVDGQKLIDIDIEAAGRESRKSNIYKGVITRVEPSLEACFVNYGEERHGFLPFKEIAKTYFKPGVDASRGRMQDALSEGMELLVQIDKEERGTKGAALTTYVSLAGRYLVLMPNNPRGGGVSRRVEGEDRQELRETMDRLDVPAGMSMIARTAGIGRTAEELQWDLNYLLQLWRAIDDASRTMSGAFLIYQESSLVIRAIRDYFTADIGEILIDTDDIFEQARQFMGHVMPDNVDRVKRYRDDTPLFSRFQIEHQIETAHSRLVPLPSGGAIVIDHTEALVSIDVNSARATRGSDIEETALRTNLEAADEVARQMRLRDLGGLIVIDFIDMESAKNQREVEQRLKDALHYDRARVQTGKISRFGLMELSRQRLRPALAEGSHVGCPRCNGTGFIRDTESAALHVIRVLQEEAMKDNSAAVYAQVPVEVATFLLNEKRAEIAKMEARLKVDVVLIPNKHLETPHYKIERIKHDDERLGSYRATYTLADGPQESEDGYLARKLEPAKPRQEAVVKSVTPAQPAPVAVRPEPAPAAEPGRRGGTQAPSGRTTGNAPSAAPGTSADGLFGRILGFFRRKAANEASASPADAVAPSAASPGAEPVRSAVEPRGRSRGEGAARGGRDDQRRRAEGRSGEGRANGARGEPRMPRTSSETASAAGGRVEESANEQRADVAESRGGRGGRGERGSRGERAPRGEPRTERPARAAAGDPGETRSPAEEMPAELDMAAALAIEATATTSMNDASASTETPKAAARPPRSASSPAPARATPDQPVAPEAIDDAIAAAEAIEQSAGNAADGETGETGEGDIARRRRRRRRGGRRDRADGQTDAADASDSPPLEQVGAGAEAIDAGSMAAVAEAAMDAEAAAGAMPELRAERDSGAPDDLALERETPPRSSTSDVTVETPMAHASAPAAQVAQPAAVPAQALADRDRQDVAVPSGTSSLEPVEPQLAAPMVAATVETTAVIADEHASDPAAAVAAETQPVAPARRPDAAGQANAVEAASGLEGMPPAPASAWTPASDAAASTAPDSTSMHSAISAAGLELIETRVRADETEEPVAAAPRAPRVRRRREAPAAEPLQQVETARDDLP